MFRFKSNIQYPYPSHKSPPSRKPLPASTYHFQWPQPLRFCSAWRQWLRFQALALWSPASPVFCDGNSQRGFSARWSSTRSKFGSFWSGPPLRGGAWCLVTAGRFNCWFQRGILSGGFCARVAEGRTVLGRRNSRTLILSSLACGRSSGLELNYVGRLSVNTFFVN